MHQAPQKDAIAPGVTSVQPQHVLTGSSLKVMPAEWIAQLHYAAAQGNDTESLKLIAQIPSEQASLTAALSRLVETYQFDQLMELTQPTHSPEI